MTVRDDAEAELLELLDPDYDDLDGDAPAAWVDPAPFRAHLRRLIRESGVPWRTLAMLAEVPPGPVEHLLLGHAGRPLRRLHPMIANRLFHLTLDVVRDAAVVPIRPGRTGWLLCRLRSRGWSFDELSRRTGLPGRELADLAAGRSRSCSQLTAATVRAIAQALWDLPTTAPSSRPGPAMAAAA
ncbi:MAG TPA: hypothetical protein VIP98_01500 [Microlunatus sp.]